MASTQSRSPFRILETLPDSENELNVYALSWEILRAFDLGCSSLRANIDPCELTDILVRRGYAIVDETAALGAHGRPEYIAKTLGLTEDRQTRILSKSRISKATYLKIRQQFERSIDDFLSRSESNRQMVEKARADFQSKVKLLGGYYSWDRRQLPIYVKRRRLSRALFEPMLIAFTGMRSERKLGEYRVGQLVVSLHRSGVACLTMWISPAKTKPAISLRAEDILEITRRLNEVTVEVGLAKQISETAQKLNSTFGLRLTRRKDLDAKANQTELASSYNAQYEVWEGSLAKLLDLYRVLIGSLSLELMGKASTRDNLRTFRGVSALGYSILHLYDFGHTISNPFEEVVKVYPRQISGILIRDRLFTNNTTQYTVFSLVDVSLREGLSSMFSASKSLTIYSSHNWNRLEEENKTRVLWWPGMAQIATTAQWEMLCSLRQLLEGYNVLLEDVSVEGGTIADLIGAEAKITRGLEEIYAATHARYRSVGYWWQLAEDELWINELEKVVRQKLEDTHMMIVTTTDRQVNRRLLWLTIVTTALTALTVVAGFQEIWRILQAFWNVATQVFLPKQNAFTYQYYLDLFSCAVTRVLTDCVSL